MAKFADMKIGNLIITHLEKMNLQEGLRKIPKWFQSWEMPFNVNKCHILLLGTRSQKIDYEINDTKLESVQCVKDIDITITSSFKSSQQCKDVVGEANRVLSFIRRNISFKNKDVY